MKDCCDKITRQYDNSSKTYKRFYADLDMTSICERTATQPSIADMLEWLQVCLPNLLIMKTCPCHIQIFFLL